MKETNIFRLLNIPSSITLLGLLLGLAAVFAVLRGMPELAIIFLYLGVWCDRLDGLVARKIHQTSDFGAELDNLSDAIVFGAAPALFIYCVTGKLWIIPFSILLTFAGVLRLARYSYVGLIERDGKKYFVGLPIPYTVGILFLIWAFVRQFDSTIQSVVLAIYAVVISLLMVSTRPIPKGSMFERFVFYVIYPIFLVYYVLLMMGIRFW